MQCPKCGYMLSVFDKSCPRCALTEKAAKPEHFAARLPATSNDNPTPIPVEPQAIPAKVITSSEGSSSEFSQQTPTIAISPSSQKTRNANVIALVMVFIALGVISLVFILFITLHSGNAGKTNSSANSSILDDDGHVLPDAPPQKSSLFLD
jgi:hypothetical protein